MAAPLSVRIGDRFGKLTIAEIFSIGKSCHRYCLCQCDCGRTRKVEVQLLRNGKATTCGCGRGTHRHTPKGVPSPTFRSWANMVNRCYHPAVATYAWYGGRGIKVCDRWRFGEGGKSGFHCFLDDMGERPSSGHSIDRMNGDGNYEPNNCRWATKREQCANRGSSTLYEFRGQKLFLHEIADECGLSRELLRHRVKRAGWPLDLAIATPPGRGKRQPGKI